MTGRGGDDQAAVPKYALIERERRCLVDPARCPVDPDAPFALIEDRYITGTRLRLRRVTGADGRVVCKLTKKYEATDPAARPIVTAYLNEAEFAVFAALSARPLRKRRFLCEGYTVDVFHESLAPLVLAEIECATSAELQAMVAPRWAILEVTGDIAYQGGTLALGLNEARGRDG